MTSFPSKPPAPLARGRALRRTPAALDALATVTPADVAVAVRLWDETAPTAYRGLLHARPETSSQPTGAKL